MSERVRVPGPREVEATLDSPAEETTTHDACVVACPPHPQMGGKRTDARLTALGEYLAERGVACLRFDYGPWDEGTGERADAGNALDWAAERYGSVGLFGYSFGSAVALLVASERADVRCVSALAPAPGLPDGVPVRARMNVTFKEYEATDYKKRVKPESTDKTKAWTVTEGDGGGDERRERRRVGERHAQTDRIHPPSTGMAVPVT